MHTYWLLLKNDFLQTSKHHDEAWFRYLHWKSVIRKKVDLNIFGYWAAIFYNLFSNLSRLVETCPSSWKFFSIFFSSDSFKFHWVHHQAKPPSYPHGNGVTPWSKHGYRPNYLMDYWHRSSVRSLLEMTSSSYYCLHFLLVKVLHSRYLVEFSKQKFISIKWQLLKNQSTDFVGPLGNDNLTKTFSLQGGRLCSGYVKIMSK